MGVEACGEIPTLPEGTPDWGVKLLEIIQAEFRNVTQHVKSVEVQNEQNAKDVKKIENKLAKVEKHNQELKEENCALRERILEIEYRQREQNLIFEGIPDLADESDISLVYKVQGPLCGIPGLQSDAFVIDKCHCLDGKYKPNSCRRVLCTFNWLHDVQCVLKNRKHLARNILFLKTCQRSGLIDEKC